MSRFHEYALYCEVQSRTVMLLKVVFDHRQETMYSGVVVDAIPEGG